MVAPIRSAADRLTDRDDRADGLSLSAAAADLVDAVLRPLRYRMRCRRMVAALERLDGRTLKDIGVDPRGIAVTTRRVVAGNLPPRPDLGQALRDVTRVIGRAWRARRRKRATMRELIRLDDRLLRDIGLDRGLVDAIGLGLDETPAEGAPSGPAFPGQVRSVEAAPAFRGPSHRLDAAPDAGDTANDNRLRRAS
jgi:uncharacterized protein YjiS (DUF1127 family)